MPPKKPVAGDSAAPLKSGRQRTLTNKQQQLSKIYISRVPLLIFFFLALLVAQKNEKEEAVKQRALSDAIWSEQRLEEINGFHKRKQSGTSGKRGLDLEKPKLL